MIQRRYHNGHGLESGAFVVLSDIFINTAFLLVIMLVAVTLTSSSALKQVQIHDDQLQFERQLKHAFAGQWGKTLRKYDNGNYQRITFAESLFFDPGRWDLKAGSHPLLDRLAPLLREQIRNQKVIKVVVEGHTDQEKMSVQLASQVQDSWGLSALRALAVVRYLQNQSLPGSSLTAVGRGEFSPLDAHRTADAFALNRRIEIILVYAAGQDQSTSVKPGQ